MVMGDNSCTKGCGFKSQCCILDGHFSTLICCKNCNVCLKRPKINEIDAGLANFLRKLVFSGQIECQYVFFNTTCLPTQVDMTS